MNQVKGLVLLSRFDYLDHIKGLTVLKEFLTKVSTPENNFVRQPVVAANYYPDSILVEADEILLRDYFDNDIEEFRRLGEWNAENLVDKFFNLYVEEANPFEFLEQLSRLRDALIGSGIMTNVLESSSQITITIDYGQSVPRSVCLSEQGFISAGLRFCGAKNVKIEELSCASEENTLECKYRAKFESRY